MNLLALLLSTRRPLSADEIREKLPDHYGSQSGDAFHRMFERDKVELRELGYPVDAVDLDVWGGEGYRITPEEATFADPGLTPDEVAALSLAAQAWGGSSGDGALAALKLGMVSEGAERAAVGLLMPRVGVDASFPRLMDALARRKRVRFRYRTGGGGEPHRREVEPHRLIHRGTWYLAAFDVERAAMRNFKLSRIEGAIEVASGDAPDFDEPPEADPSVPRGPWEGETIGEALVAFAPDVSWWAERRTGATVVSESEEGERVLRLSVADVEAFAGWVAGFGEKAVVVDPPEVRDAVIAHLRGIVGEP